MTSTLNPVLPLPPGLAGQQSPYSMKRKFAFILILLAAVLSVSAQQPSVSIGVVKIDNIGMNKRMVRLSENGLIVDNAGMCVEVNVKVKATGLAGGRLLCQVMPTDQEGNMYEDKYGLISSSGAINIPTSNFSGDMTIPLPFAWVINDANQKMESVNLGVSLICFGDEEEDDIEDSKIVHLSGADIDIDRSQLGRKLIGDALGFSDEAGAMETLLGGLFDTSDAESTQPCPVCDGTGVCQHCDGDAYVDPRVCRKCNADPGICRRCKGTGTVTIKYDIY